MPRIDLVVETPLSRTARVRQLEAMFDVPPAEKARLEWHGELPIDATPWNVGLIVGPSGCGKTSIARQLWPEQLANTPKWESGSVIDDFPKSVSMQQISEVCSAVGFNTIPAWMRPHAVLSNGEKFRVELARRMVEPTEPIVVDEFTSVVDRQVAQIGSHAVQKFVRKNGLKFVAVACHYDIIDWLQPDWVLEPSTMAFSPRGRLQRPQLECSIRRVTYDTWRLFAPFHYLTADLHKSARCFGLFVGDRIAAFAATIHRPHSRVDDIQGVSRLVTLPDWQGMGLAFALVDRLGSAYKAVGKRLHTYPAHPSLTRAFGKSPSWAMVTRPLDVANMRRQGESSNIGGKLGGRPCAVFCYRGPAMEEKTARALLDK